MADDKSAASARNTASDSHIPPPTDPYVTYQTPYPRKPSEDIQNPFIEFRRLADSAFSSFFSGLPRVLGTDKFKENNIKEADQEFVKAFDRQAKEFEDRIAEMVKARAEEAEGFRKQLEQEWEERRRENEKRMEEESQKWEMMRRGLEKCPGLRPDTLETKREAETELDLYDGLKAYQSALYRPCTEPEPKIVDKCPWKDEEIDKKCVWNQEHQGQNSWLAGLGWDGRRRAKNIPLFAPKSLEAKDNYNDNADWQAYRDQEMDPFSNDDHVVPWLRLSPYSPLSLISNQARSDDHSPVRMSNDARRALSEIPWDDAFEDLMAVHKTGKLPDAIRRLVYWGGPNQWMTDMALRGSLGHKWEEGFMVAALMGAVDGNRWRGFDGLKEQCSQLAGREFRDSVRSQPLKHVESTDDAEEMHKVESNELPSYNDWVDLVREAFGPKAWEVSAQMEELVESIFGERPHNERKLGARGMSWPSPEEVIGALLETKHEDYDEEAAESSQGLLEGAESSSSEQQPSLLSSSSISNVSQRPLDIAKANSLISTLTTTTTTTLPDGSTETIRVLKKRFADGREESSESTETTPSKALDAKASDKQTKHDFAPKETKNASGWFWN